jgi:hypothetical protein
MGENKCGSSGIGVGGYAKSAVLSTSTQPKPLALLVEQKDREKQ